MIDSVNLNKIFGGRSNPSRQYMQGKLFDYRQRLKLLASGELPHYAGKETVNTCREYIETIEQVINTPGFLWSKKTFSAWHLFHRLDETFLLLMEAPELKAQGMELIQGYKSSSLLQQTKSDWLTRLQDMMKKLDGDPEEKDYHEAAHLFKSALYGYNDFVDNLFWDVWCKKFIALIYTFVLMLLLFVFVAFAHFNAGISVCLITVLMVGAMGGLTSGLITFDSVSFAYGHFWSVTFYHTFVRPLLGAIAALMVFWLLQSQYLITIDPPLKPGTKIVYCDKGLPCEFPVVIDPPKHSTLTGSSICKQGDLAFTKISSAVNKNNQTTITLKAAEGMQIYLYLLVLLIAGFSGDKVLKFVTDKVSNKLFAEAEKTKEAK